MGQPGEEGPGGVTQPTPLSDLVEMGGMPRSINQTVPGP
jgi:hypothetical protein